MDARGLFEMFIIFTIMIGCGAVVLDKNQPETTRAQAFAIVAGLVGVVCPSPIMRSIKRVKENSSTNETENE
jgi:hypothetical protein